MIDLMLVLKGAPLAATVANYLGITENQLKVEINRLAASELDAGVRALRQAAESDQEQRSLLREARGCFNRAISLEDGFRLAAAYIGLALCHVHLGDVVNAEVAIKGLVSVERPTPSMVLKAGRLINKAPWYSVAIVGPLAPQFVAAKIAAPAAEKRLVNLETRIAELIELQRMGKLLLKRSLCDGAETVFGLQSPKKTTPNK